MKKTWPYILGAVVLLLLVVLVMANKDNVFRRLDERITLKARDKIPYGTYASKELLPSLFTKATIAADTYYPGSWDNVHILHGNQAVILMADYFDADEDELRRLKNFVEKGNYIFIVARSISYEASRFFDLSVISQPEYFNYSPDDSLQLQLLPPFFRDDSFYVYPGKQYDAYINNYNAPATAVLGRNDNQNPNFVRLDAGRGSFFLHTAPLAFSNWFVLHKNNSRYVAGAFSVLPENLSVVLWNEYYLEKPKRGQKEEDRNWLRTLFSYPSFKWGLLTALFALLVFVLLGMRRNQRMIPPKQKPASDSLDFVKTLGRLYYDQADHKNLASKMTSHFLEHVRSVYKISTQSLDDDFVERLHFRSGYNRQQLIEIVQTIGAVATQHSISEERLAAFHQQLEKFYQNT